MRVVFLSEMFPVLGCYLEKLPVKARLIIEVVVPPAPLLLFVGFSLARPVLAVHELVESYDWRSRSASYYEYIVSELEKSAPRRGWSDKGPEKRRRDEYRHWTVHPQA